MDLLNNKFTTLHVTAIPENKKIKSLGDYNITCNNDEIVFIPKSNFAEIFSHTPHLSIDVSDEYEFIPIEDGTKNIPLYEIENYAFEDNTIPIVLYCKSGLRSKQAALLLSKKGMKNIFCLTYN